MEIRSINVKILGCNLEDKKVFKAPGRSGMSPLFLRYLHDLKIKRAVHLTIKNESCSSEGLGYLIEQLNKNRTLETIYLYNFHLHTDSVIAILKALKTQELIYLDIYSTEPLNESIIREELKSAIQSWKKFERIRIGTIDCTPASPRQAAPDFPASAVQPLPADFEERSSLSPLISSQSADRDIVSSPEMSNHASLSHHLDQEGQTYESPLESAGPSLQVQPQLSNASQPQISLQLNLLPEDTEMTLLGTIEHSPTKKVGE